MSYINAKTLQSNDTHYFLHEIEPGQRGLNRGDLSFYRCRDKDYVYRENPIGVVFFSEQSVQYILKAVKPVCSEIFDESDVLQEMTKQYRAEIENTNGQTLNSDTQSQLVERLQLDVIKELRKRCVLQKMRRTNYATYYRGPTAQPLPQRASNRQHAMINNVGHLELRDKRTSSVIRPKPADVPDSNDIFLQGKRV